jgi:hypothetical protein
MSFRENVFQKVKCEALILFDKYPLSLLAATHLRSRAVGVTYVNTISEPTESGQLVVVE